MWFSLVLSGIIFRNRFACHSGPNALKVTLLGLLPSPPGCSWLAVSYVSPKPNPRSTACFFEPRSGNIGLPNCPSALQRSGWLVSNRDTFTNFDFSGTEGLHQADFFEDATEMNRMPYRKNASSGPVIVISSTDVMLQIFIVMTTSWRPSGLPFMFACCLLPYPSRTKISKLLVVKLPVNSIAPSVNCVSSCTNLGACCNRVALFTIIFADRVVPTRTPILPSPAKRSTLFGSFGSPVFLYRVNPSKTSPRVLN